MSNFIWKVTSLVVFVFLVLQLAVISPLLLVMLMIYKGAAAVAPDVFKATADNCARRILLCVDPTSFQSVNWTARDFIRKGQDHLIVLHVQEPTEAIKIPTEVVRFNSENIDTKNFFIPQYMSEFCHWLGRNNVCYEGIITETKRGQTVAETIIKIAQDLKVDCILASASERTGTTDVGNVAFQVAVRSPITTVIVNRFEEAGVFRIDYNMSSNDSACPINATYTTQPPEGLKPCCACPETRKLRDDCVFMKGEESCSEFIEKHKECLRSYGFKVE